jgi:hypothetical protein
MSSEKEKVLLAYSGGLDTSVILKWLLDKGYEVICFMGDLAQDEDFQAAKEKALKIGATDVSYPTFESCNNLIILTFQDRGERLAATLCRAICVAGNSDGTNLRKALSTGHFLGPPLYFPGLNRNCQEIWLQIH